MGEVIGKLTVYFDEPYWVGVFERLEMGKLSVAKVTFGAEPKDYQVYEFIEKHYGGIQYSPAVAAAVKTKPCNPKRMQRQVKSQLRETGIGTKAQQALQLLREQNKTECKTKSRLQKSAEEEHRFDLKQQKKKDKHRGH